MSLRHKIFVGLLAAVFLSAVVVVVPMILGAKQLVTQGSEREIALLESEINHALKARIDRASVAAAMVAEIPEVGEAMAKGDRARLEAMFVPGFEVMQSRFGFAQFQFHDPNAHSFLRVHKPEDFGDDLSSFRQTVVAANRDKTPVAGLERGRAGLGIRGIATVEHDGAHVGTVEVGLRLDSSLFSDFLEGGLNLIEVYVLPDQNLAGVDADQSDTPAQRTIASFDGEPLMSQEAIMAVLSDEGHAVENVHFAGHDYASHDLILHDYSGAPVAMVHLMMPLDSYNAISDAMNERAIMAGAAALLLGAIGAFLFGGWVSGALNRLIDRMQVISEGNTEISLETDLKRSGEFGRMAKALEVFRLGLIDQARLQEEEARMQAAARAAEEERRAAEEERRWAEAEQEKAETFRKTQELEREKNEQEQRNARRAAREAEQANVVSRLAQGMDGLANGNLDCEIAEAFPENYEALRLDFNKTVSKLGQLIGSIGTSVNLISGQVDSMAAASGELSQRTERSAATVEETVTALDELTNSVKSAAQGARLAGNLVQETDTEAKASSGVVSDTVSAMEDIERSSSEIVKIIDVIDDISFQTNLLALNAGVEAARAGEAGRGFAVVASEVRALAQRSSEAAREIHDLISASESQVKHGVNLVGKTGDTLGQIAGKVNEILSHVADIADGADEQASGIGEINAAVSDIERTIQQNAAMSEETTASTMSLSEEAQKLAKMVAQFQLPAPGQGQTHSEAA